jgi:HSP20 family protein
MMAASGWDPFRELAGLQERLDRMFRDIDRTRMQQNFISSQWMPPVDIIETQDLFVIKLEIPEVDRESIDISMEGGELTIAGARKLEQGTEREQYLRMDRGYGSFTRSFSLTKTIDASEIKASIKDGILRIELPKKEEIKPKQIIIEGP